MVYFDHNATTPLDARVLEAMAPYLGDLFGNPSSLHRLGRLARSAIDRAREQVAALVGAQASEVIFTCGGTEANNLALKGLADAGDKGLIALGATEHPSVQEPALFLARRGWRMSVLPVDRVGSVELENLYGLPVAPLRCVSVMYANNETGVVQPVAAIGEYLRERDIPFHCDAVQAAGKIPVDFNACHARLMSLSSHKIYGPKGAGALIVRRGTVLEPILHGGGQEKDLRGGTENVAAIVGFGKAAELAAVELDQRSAHLTRLRRRLETGLQAFEGITLFAQAAARLPNTIQLGVAGIDGETLVMALDRHGFAVSSGSACASGGSEPSPVLLAMGVDPELARCAVRISLGKDNQDTDVDQFIVALRSVIGRFATA